MVVLLIDELEIVHIVACFLNLSHKSNLDYKYTRF